MKRSGVGLLLAMVVCSVPATAQFEVHGTAGEVARFGGLVLECASQSPLFAGLLGDIEAEALGRRFELIVSLDPAGNPGGHFVHRIDTYNRSTHIFRSDYTSQLGLLERNAFYIDLEDLMAFPLAERDDATGSFRVPAILPQYAPTRCQALGHELKEQLDGHTSSYGFDYTRNHRVALAFENAMRAELGQRPRSDAQSAGPNRRSFTVGTATVILETVNDRMVIRYP